MTEVCCRYQALQPEKSPRRPPWILQGTLRTPEAMIDRPWRQAVDALALAGRTTAAAAAATNVRPWLSWGSCLGMYGEKLWCNDG